MNIGSVALSAPPSVTQAVFSVTSEPSAGACQKATVGAVVSIGETEGVGALLETAAGEGEKAGIIVGVVPPDPLPSRML